MMHRFRLSGLYPENGKLVRYTKTGDDPVELLTKHWVDASDFQVKLLLHHESFQSLELSRDGAWVGLQKIDPKKEALLDKMVAMNQEMGLYD